MKLIQYIDGYDPVILRNVLFCYKNNIPMYGYSGVDNVILYRIKNDVRQVITVEETLQKDFEDVTIYDVLNAPVGIGILSFWNSMYFRYFNFKLIQDIYKYNKLKRSEIVGIFKCSDARARTLVKMKCDDKTYIDRFLGNHATIYTSKNNVDLNPELSLDYSVECIKALGNAEDPVRDITLLSKGLNVKFGKSSIRKIKELTRNRRFYKSYITQINKLLKEEPIKFKGILYNASKAGKNIPYFYYLIRLAINDDIPGRKWDKKLGVVKTDE